MKAIVFEKYGSPDNLLLKEIDQPIVKDDEVLIRTHAASINSWDMDIVRGDQFIIRALHGLFKPKLSILGCDIAGIVESVGKNVKNYLPGDAVFGDTSASGWGGFAEYASVKETALHDKPDFLSFEEAASLPQAGVMALQSLQDHGEIKKGDKVLIIGAGGGIGTLVIQMAKNMGTVVTAIDNHTKLKKLLSLGANVVIDYQQEDFSKNGIQYDLIIDVVANRSINTYKKSLKPHGKFEMIGGKMSSILQAAFLGPLLSNFSKKRLGILVHEPNKNLLQLTEFIHQGKVRPIIDKQFPLSETADAFKYFAEGNFFGKVVITMTDS